MKPSSNLKYILFVTNEKCIEMNADESVVTARRATCFGRHRLNWRVHSVDAALIGSIGF